MINKDMQIAIEVMIRPMDDVDSSLRGSYEKDKFKTLEHTIEMLRAMWADLVPTEIGMLYNSMLCVKVKEQPKKKELDPNRPKPDHNGWRDYIRKDVMTETLPVCPSCGEFIIPAIKPLADKYHIHFMCTNLKCEDPKEFGDSITEIVIPNEIDMIFNTARKAFSRA